MNKQRDLLKGGQRSIFALDSVQRDILKDNIFGVDLNEESVEITKLSLWLKTANKYKPLTNLDDNIRCGNSLIDDPTIAGDKAFKWEEEFKDVMRVGGFDVVIGNPPYVGMRKLDKNYIKYLKNNYVSLDNRINLFQAFIEISINILKENGNFGVIIHRNIIRSNEYMGIRKLILKKH